MGQEEPLALSGARALPTSEGRVREPVMGRGSAGSGKETRAALSGTGLRVLEEETRGPKFFGELLIYLDSADCAFLDGARVRRAWEMPPSSPS